MSGEFSSAPINSATVSKSTTIRRRYDLRIINTEYRQRAHLTNYESLDGAASCPARRWAYPPANIIPATAVSS